MIKMENVTTKWFQKFILLVFWQQKEPYKNSLTICLKQFSVLLIEAQVIYKNSAARNHIFDA